MSAAPRLTAAEQAAWRPALDAAYKARGIDERAGKPFTDKDRWNVKCIRAARGLLPEEGGQ
jgi:hypothetical protein